MVTNASTASPSTEEIDQGYGTNLIDLTDEELSVLDPVPREQRLAIMPYLDDVDDVTRETATLTAFRSLVARGLVVPPTAAEVEAATNSESTTGSIDIEVHELISGLVQMRKGAPTIVCAQRTVAGRPDYCYWYVVSDDTAIEELVEPKGLHRFHALETRLVRLALYGYLNPERVAGAAGEDHVVEAGVAAGGSTPAAMLEGLASAHTLGEFLVRTGRQPSEQPTMVAVASGPEGLLLAEMRCGSEEPVRVREIDAATLFQRIEAAMTGAMGSETIGQR